MRIFIVLLSSMILLSFNETNKDHSESIKKQKKVEVVINKTIETFMILRSIANNDPLFQYRDSTYKGKPIMYEARKTFSDYKNHPAVKETQIMLNTTSNTGDLILQGLLYFEELPSNSLKYEISSENWKDRKDSLIAYMNTLQKFYKDAKVDEFISNHSDFYNGAITEAKLHLDDSLVTIMEDYFGIENYAYKMILIPNSPFGMGFGASVKSDKGDIFYQIISPANDIEWNNNSVYDTYGFSGEGAKEYYRDLVVHEFCHPFITPFIDSEKMRNEIAKSESLYVPKLDSIMSNQGYNSWWGFVNEHLVRLAEIRIAKKMEIEDFEEMRDFNIKENGFVLLPDAEKLIVNYESSREKYKNFQEFIPELIEQLNGFSKQEIEEKIQLLTKDMK